MSTPPHQPKLITPWSHSDSLVARVLAQPVQAFLRTEAASGLVLLSAAAAALAWANSPWSGSYEQLWATDFSLQVGGWELQHSLRDWVNDLAMALFFFVAGLEIKRELVHGDLRSARSATLPIACAIGGMVVPAGIFLALNAGGSGARGWGIPMATDIAFSIGVLALVGKRTPPSLKVFLLTLAIVDDIGAIVIIAIFYSSDLSLPWLAGAAGSVVAIVGLRRIGVQSLVPYVMLAGLLWLFTLESGVHATIAGVVLGLLTPARPLQHPATVQGVAVDRLSAAHLQNEVSDEQDETTLLEVSSLTSAAVSPLGRLERRFHPWSSFLVLPIFALANAGIALSGEIVSSLWTSSVSLGIFVGLLVGKPIGIMAAALVAVRFGGARLPARAGWTEVLGAGVLAGIGFTVSIFIAGLAFDGAHENEAKLAILAASVLAGAVGAGLLLVRRVPESSTDPPVVAHNMPLES